MSASQPSHRDLQPAPDGYAIKLVRDLTPEVINATGEPGELFYAVTPDADEYFMALKSKLGEEVTEYLLSGGVNELADIISAVWALAAVHLTREGIDATVLANSHPRGGFSRGVMMYGRHREFDK